ncbi:hypothetical protein G6F71_006929 [Rhizopus microsporus]|nr:hypothetical protein G6F71_006929 [Rhizopus microsporus]KAG1208885.1 hypothetical protein G6F69_006828 [Rhizopus microsporus]
MWWPPAHGIADGLLYHPTLATKKAFNHILCLRFANITIEIKAAIHTLSSTGMPINIAKICEQLKSCIVESYDNATSLIVYKTAWCSRISKVLNDLNIKYGKTRPNWEHIAMAINDKRLGLSHYAPQAPGNVGSGDSELSSLTTTSSDSSSSSTTKQLKLFSDDKEKVKHMFNNLNESKMWKLSIGTIVEKKMKEFALNCTYEHPVHSMVLDLSDINWKKYLTDEEIDEIENFKMKQLVELPPNVNKYIESLQKSTDAISLKRQLTQELECPASDWISNTLLEYLKLFKYNHLPLTDQSEGDVLRRVWIFLDTVFDDSKISCRGGEKSSKSSSATRNNEGAIAGEEKMERKLIGRKVDLLFKRVVFT